MPTSIFLSAGEASGDARGAELIRALRARDSSLTFFGMGGPLMRAEGMEIIADVSNLAVVGILEVLKNYGTFRRTMNLLCDEIRSRRPAVVIGVDYPGFNLRLHKRVSRIFDPSSPFKIRKIQYVSPQLWAWKENRKWKMAQFLDLVLCIFPFEPPIYESTGLKAVFVGHPLSKLQPSTEKRDPNLVALFPGSRECEIDAHLPVLMELERTFLAEHPSTQFVYAAESPERARQIKSLHPTATIGDPVTLRNRAGQGVVSSGTATLEAALAGLPICVIYRVAWPTYWMGRALIRIPNLAMPNILLKQPLIAEFIQSECHAGNLCDELNRLRSHEESRLRLEDGYRKIRRLLSKQNASENAASEILPLIQG